MNHKKIIFLLFSIFILLGCKTVSSNEGTPTANVQLINNYIDQVTKSIKKDGLLGKFFDSQNKMFPNAANLPSSKDSDKQWTAPKLIRAESAIYPDHLKQLKKVGIVHVAILIGENGKVIDTKIENSNNPEFNEAAILTVKKWDFSSALLDNFPSQSVLVLPIEFRL